MKKGLLSLLILICFISCQSQIKITDFPTYIGNPSGGWVPIVINGINRKMDADLIGYNQVDSLTIGIGTTSDTFYIWKHGSIAFYQTYPHPIGGGGSGVSSVGLVMPGGFTVTPSTLNSPGIFTVSTAMNGVIHASGGAFAGGQIIDADVHDINFGKLTNVPTTKIGFGLTDVMAYTDTASLSNRINAKIGTTDTASLLNPYLRKSDTISLSNRINGKLSLTDTSAMLNPYLRKVDTLSLNNRLNNKINISDTSFMLASYLRKIDTLSLSTRINGKVNISDTSNMLSVYLRKADTISLNNRIATKVNISDTSSMLASYLRKGDTANMLSVYLRKLDTASLSNRINLKVNIADTSNMLAHYLRKGDTSAMLSPYLRGSVANTLYYPLSLNPTGYYKPTDTSLVLATQYYVTQHGSIYTAGYGMGLTGGNAFFVDTSSNKIATQNYVLTHSGTAYFAGNGLTLTGTLFKADTTILATQYDNGLKLNKTDTGAMLASYVRTSVANTNYYPRSSNPSNYLSSVDTGNISSFSVKVRGLFAGGTGINYNAATGIISNSITNTNQLTNGAGFITGINSSMVTTALGYTPLNPNGTSSQYFRGDGVLATFAFNNLGDITVTSPSNNQLMRYNTSTSKWVNFTPSFYQPTDTVATLATKSNIIKDTVIGFQVGDGGSFTPSNGTTTYSNPILQFAQLVNVFKGDTVLPTFAITGGKPYVTFNSTTGIITLHNTTFLTGQAVTVQYTFGNGSVVGGGGGGGGNVTSVFGRTGAILGQSSDYASFYYAIPTGTTSQYIRGDGSFATFPTLATVATSGSYTDLLNKPLIPNNTNQLTNGAGFITGITSSQIISALGYTPFNPSGSALQYIKGDGTYATTDTTMIPGFFTKVRSLFTAGSGIAISNGAISTNLNSGNIVTALGYTPANQTTAITINGSTFDLSANRSYTVNYATLGDVTLTSLLDGQLVKYNNGTGKWVNFTPSYLTTVDTGNISNFYVKVRSLFSSGSGISITNGIITNTINNTNQLINGAGYLSSIDTFNISNFSVKVRSLFSAAGGGLSYSNGVFTTDTTSALATKTNVGLRVKYTDTASMLTPYLRSAVAATTYYPLSSNPSGYYKPTDTVSTLATQFYVTQHINAGTITSVAGTTNQINSSTTGGAVTLSLPATVHITGTMMIGSTSGLQWGDGGTGGTINGSLAATGNGIFEFSNAAANDFTRLMLGGTTNLYPAIARNSTGIDIKLADNSGYTTIQSSGFIKNGATSAQYLMGDGSVSTITAGTGILFSAGIIKADTSTANVGLATLYQSGLRVKYSDTTGMLNPYLRKIDTSTLSTRINLKVNISDTAAMLSPYLRSTLAATTYYPLSSNPSGYYKPTDTISTLATLYDLNNTFDTIRVVPYTNTGTVLLRMSNDSLRPKPLIAGANITLTQNSDSTVTISSTGGGGGTDSAVFAGLGLSKSTTTTNITLLADTSYLMTKNTNQLSTGNKTFSGTIKLTTGNTYAVKPNVISLDTTTGQLYHTNAQFIDTTGLATGKIVYWNGTSFAVETNPGGGGGTDSAVLAGLGLTKSVSTTNITLLTDTSYLMTKNTNQTASGNKIFSGILNFTGILNDTASLTKTKVLVQDTTNGKVYNYSFQTIDTTGKINNSSVVWNTSAGHFVMASPLNFGSSTQSGNGSTTSFTIAHGLTGITSSSFVIVTPRTAAAANIAYVTTDATNITIVYTTAPANGSNNLTWSYEIRN